MFGFKKNKSSENSAAESKGGLFSSLKSRLLKTRSNLTAGIADIFLGKKQIDDDLMEQLEDQLLMADVGIQATQQITAKLAGSLARKELKDSDSIFTALEDAMLEILAVSDQPLHIDRSKKPFVILMAGINGAGKTTTIGKLAVTYGFMEPLRGDGHQGPGRHHRCRRRSGP